MIELKKLNKTYDNGKVSFHALRDIDLKIEQGEFVAIMGPSGSGKSTLLHLLGFLDKPDSGVYNFFDHNVANLSEDQLCHVRRHLAGFVFQQFHLLPGIKAEENVNLPLIYSGKSKQHNGDAQKQLQAVGLAHRAAHVPNELSGGERQRVAIARALINDPVVLFADEPTGNLDTKSEAEIMGIIKDLNAKGITIVMVTHEQEIAAQAERIITMRDGRIISDQRKREKTFVENPERKALVQKILSNVQEKVSGAEFFDYIKQALRAILANKMRAILSMLGILIGVAAVIAMLALGNGATDSIEADLSSLGSNLLIIRQGNTSQGGVSLGAAAFSRFKLNDVESLKKITALKYVSGEVSGKGQAIYQGKNWNTTIMGVQPVYAYLKSYQPTSGRFINENDLKNRERVALVGTTIVKELFGNKDPLGQTIRVNKVNFNIVGVLPEKGYQMGRNNDEMVMVPLSTAMYRLLGKQYLDMIEVEVGSSKEMTTAKQEIRTVLNKLHNYKSTDEDSIDIRDMSEIQQTVKKTISTITMLLGFVAAIALVVGGIGIMNIMLVSVTERTREIGLRKAIGASKQDIMSQFLVESVMLTVTGGILGILLGMGASGLVTLIAKWATRVSTLSIVISTGFSIATGILFGLWPAKQAANLNTIEALRYDYQLQQPLLQRIDHPVSYANAHQLPTTGSES
jgi:macrolide transport system ATP-binding/permease protein